MKNIDILRLQDEEEEYPEEEDFPEDGEEEADDDW